MAVQDDLLTIADVANRYPIPLATLRFWRHKGVGPHSFRLGRRVVYKQSDVDAWLEQQYSATGSSGA